MKRELWAKVKVGSHVIYADEYEGVFKAKVTEIDIRVYEPGTPSRWGYPYGKTEAEGAVRIQYESQTKIENLADLVTYGATKYAVLRRDWSQWQSRKLAAEPYRTTFLERILEYRTY